MTAFVAANATRPAPTANTAPAPTATRPAPTVAPTAAPTATQAPAAVPKQVAAELASNGLGLTQAEWEAKHGQGQPDAPGFLKYQGGAFIVSLRDGRVRHIEQMWGDRNAQALDPAAAAGKALLPQDAQFTRTYTSRAGRRVDLFKSEALAGVFAEDVFDDEPGECIVIYRQAPNGRVIAIVVATGNNP